MVTVAEELPFVAVVDEKKLDTVCSNCFAVKNSLNEIDLKRCGGCKVVHYCCKACQKGDWKFHKDECQFIRNSDNRKLEVRIMSRFIMRERRGDLPVAFNGRTYDDLMDHKDKIEKNVDKYKTMKKVYRDLLIFMGRENAPSFKEFSSFYGKHCINSFCIKHTGVFNPIDTLGMALYLGLAAHNHSCRPTADYYFIGSKIVLYAKDPNAKYSKDLTISYTQSVMTRSCRQKLLRYKGYFDCDCELCVDEETTLLQLSGRSVCCPTEGVVLPVDKKFLWYWQQPLVCTNCGERVQTTLEQLNEVNETVAEMYKERENIFDNVHCQADVDDLIKLLEGLERFLSPYNVNLLEFTVLAAKADVIVNKTSPLVRKFVAAENELLEKYSVFNLTSRILLVVVTLKIECDQACNNPRRIAFAKFDASCQKAFDVVHELYGPEHSLSKEIAQFSVRMKIYYNRSVGTIENDKKTDEKKTAEGGGDH